jgi:hypothetical protein
MDVICTVFVPKRSTDRQYNNVLSTAVDTLATADAYGGEIVLT